MGNLNKIFNSLNVVSEGATYNTIGLLVSKSGTTANPGVTSFVVRDDSKTGVNTILPTSMLTVSGDCRVTDLPTGGSLMVTADIMGKLHTSVMPVIEVDPNCPIVSATSNNCILTLINCTGGTITADTCNTFGSVSPYKYGQGWDSIIPTLPSIFFDNFVDASSTLSNIGGGAVNSISGTSTGNIAGGVGNVISGAHCDGIGSGYYNQIRLGDVLAGSYHPVGVSYIAGGYQNLISGETVSGSHFIGTGYQNKIMAGTGQFDGIMCGDRNEVRYSNFSAIVGGGQNIIGDGIYQSRFNFIGGGEFNLIKGSKHSSILGGSGNTIYDNTVGYNNTVRFGAIVNGSDNLVKHSSSAVIGADGRTTDKTHVTYTNGVDIDSDLFNGGTRYLKYHGSLANPTVPGRVLTDVDGLGNAVWLPGGVIQTDPNCPIVSATSNNCILTLINCTGGTITADTCNTFGSTSPYEYRGVNSISTVLPGNSNPGDNFIKNSMAWSNIGGGYENKLNAYGPGYNNVSGGYDNVIGGTNIAISLGNAAYSFIGGGYSNRLTGLDHYYDVITGGYKNRLNSGGFTFIGGGRENIITGATSAGIVGGKENMIYTSGDQSSIVGGYRNTVFSQSSVIGGGVDNTVGDVLGGTTQYAGIFNGSGNTIGRTAEYSAIIGSRGINYANSRETTYMKGLDANTNGYEYPLVGSDRPFKYHGTYANPGPAPGKVLTDSDGLGNAVWMDLPGIPSVTGCSITGVTVVGCVGTYITDCGTTITADTCGGTYSPYRPIGGINSITTTLSPNNTFASNTIDITSSYSTISAGMTNNISNQSSWSNVVGGINNSIDQSRLSAILIGRDNLISVPGGTSAGHGVILNGAYNTVSHSHSVIMGAESITTDRQNTVFMNGLDVFTNASTVFGGASQQPFKYHGTFANQGPAPGKILIDSDGLGNAVWAKGGTVQTDPNCPIVSATSDNCVLTLINCTGGTLTADTCGVYSGPYRAGTGANSIEPVVGFSFSNGPYTNIGGGVSNVTHQSSFYSNIDGGSSNFISGGTGNVIGGGMSNTIKDYNLSTIVGGVSNNIDSTYGATINGGKNNLIKGASWYSSVGGYQNTIEESQRSTIGNGSVNTITTSDYSVIGGGYGNNIKENSPTGTILNGQGNTVSASTYSSILGGTGGLIEGSLYGSIVGGQNNHIHSADVSIIVNGYNNNILHDNSVILGTANRTTSLSFTTYLDGLDVDSVGQGGARYLKYHGALANPGTNKVLTSVDNLGNAVWANPAGVTNLTGDEVVVSAQTSGCILTLTTNSGSTITANTCTTYSSPYTDGQGTSNIRPVAPGGGLQNTTDINSWYNGIQSGYMNHIGRFTARSSILGGNSNSMSGSNYSTIVGGAVNSIKDSTGGVIVNGSGNKILSGIDGAAIIGTSTVEAYIDQTTYMKHQQVHGRTRISSEEYNDTNSLNTSSAKMTLDVVHDTSTIDAVTSDTSGGEIVRFGGKGSGYATGALVQLRGGTWELAKNTDTTKQGNMLGIALGSNPSNEGVLIRGFSRPNTFNNISSDIGQPIYVGATSGTFTTTVPTSSGNYLRVVGYQVRGLDGGIPIYFNPESTYITIQ